MIIYLAGIDSKMVLIEELKPPNVLSSFAYMRQRVLDYIKSADCKNYLLDSGAFTFMNKRKQMDFDSYTDRYIDFINANNVDRFFELDIDSIVGLPKVEQLRNRIEAKTGKQTIPVFHRERGKDYFQGITKDYKYIAIGGIALKDIAKAEHKYFKWFIDTAHKNGCRIHGLGYTDFSNIKKYKFDTIDSTSWSMGGRAGSLYYIRDGTLKIKNITKKDHRIDYLKLDRHNLKQWIKYQEYMEKIK